MSSRFGPDLGQGKKKKFFKGDGEKFQLSKEGTYWIIALLTVMILTISIFIFLVIPNAEEKVRQQTIQEVDVNAMPKVAVAVVKPGVEKISKYTLLTEEMVMEMTETVEVPMPFVIENAVPDTNLLIGKVTTVDLLGNSQISDTLLTDQSDWFGEYDRLKEYKIANTVSGQAQVGNIVDVVVQYGNGDYDVVLAKKKITNINGKLAMNQTTPENSTTQATTFGTENEMVFAVDEEEFGNLELASQMGKLAIRLYVDEGQEPSQVTFNVGKANEKLEAQKQEGNKSTVGQ